MGLANKITILRILLVPVLLIGLLYYKVGNETLRFAVLGLFVVCGMTDAIDGYIARRFYQKTKIGSILDPLADKILILTAYISLSTLENIPLASKIPPWLTIIVMSRDTIILLGLAIIFVVNKEMEIKPSIMGKITTFIQMLTVIAALLHFNLIYVLWWVCAFFTIISGFGYVWRGTKVLNEAH
ncbi:MAG: CDP-diacylglycerol--glycerol-3-phosphate 3-phosphatidyltransferase [Candidatus Omnitrophota bacterium]